MFKKILNKYNCCGSFTYKIDETYSHKCNAPSDKSGVYLIYKIVEEQEILIYIGASGQKTKDGSLKVRIGGLRDRLINGYHPNRFGENKRIKRSKAFPLHMNNNKINKIRIYWWVTFDEENNDFPTDVESKLRNIYLSKFNSLPEWHN